MMIHLCDRSIHIGPRCTSHTCIIHTHTHQTSTRLVQSYTATWTIHIGNLSPSIHIHLLPTVRCAHVKQILYRACLCKLASPNFIDAFTAKVGVTVWPFASCNIDRAVFCSSKLRPFGWKVGRRTGVMSTWGAYRPIKAAVPISAGRTWWTGRRRMKGGRQIKAQRFSFPTEALKVRKTKVQLAPWNLKDLSQITKDHIASQPKFNRDGGISVCTDNLASLGTILKE